MTAGTRTVSFHDGDEEKISKEEIPKPDVCVEVARHSPVPKGSTTEMVGARAVDPASSRRGGGSGARSQAGQPGSFSRFDGSLSTTSSSPSGSTKRKHPEELQKSLLVCPDPNCSSFHFTSHVKVLKVCVAARGRCCYTAARA